MYAKHCLDQKNLLRGFQLWVWRVTRIKMSLVIVILKMCDWTCFFVAIFWKSNFSIIQISEQIPNIWAYSQSNLWPHLVLCQSNLGIFPTFCLLTLLWTKDADKRGLDEKPLLGYITLGFEENNSKATIAKNWLKWKTIRNLMSLRVAFDVIARHFDLEIGTHCLTN